MIGSATVRESRFAWSREKRAPAGRRQGDAVARDAGRQRRRLGDAEREPVGRRRPRRARAAAAGCRRRASPPRRRAARRRSPAARRGGARSGARARSRRSPRAGRRGRGRAPARRRTARSSSAISRRWPISSAAAAPACSATSKLLRTSGSIASQSQPASQGTRTMWAELETGSSSAGPWTMPSASARGRDRCRRRRRSSAARARRLGARRGVLGLARRPPPRRRLISR